MKRTKNSFKLLSKLSNAFLPFISIMIIVPFILLFGLGVKYLFENHYLLKFIIVWTFFTFLVYILYSVYQWFKNRKIDELENIVIEPSFQWSQHDNEIWKELDTHINKNVKKGFEWSEMQEYVLELVSLTAHHYHPKNSEKELAFTLAEALLAVEEVSRRYRHYVNEHIPGADTIKLSLLKQTYNHKDKLEKAKYAYNAYRIFRLVSTPTIALVSETKGLISNKFLESLSDSVQNKLKIALLKEVASVTIDLYSGKFKVVDGELNESKILLEDKKSQPVIIEPLRVAIIGQVNSGKSSLINALTSKMVAEVSVVPSTDKISVHECKIDELDMIHLVDLQGLDGTVVSEEVLLKQMTESDLIIWLVKANQPARKLDTELKNKFDIFYKKDENRNRKQPQILLVVNQVDKLQPINEWQPPYDIVNCKEEDRKACTIKDALNYNQELLNIEEALPLSISPNKTMYNLDELKKYMQSTYIDGINTQLNRRRNEYTNSDFTKQVKRFSKLAKQLFNL